MNLVCEESIASLICLITKTFLSARYHFSFQGDFGKQVDTNLVQFLALFLLFERSDRDRNESIDRRELQRRLELEGDFVLHVITGTCVYVSKSRNASHHWGHGIAIHGDGDMD